MRKLELFYCPTCKLDFGADKKRDATHVQCPTCIDHEEIVYTERTVNFRPYAEEDETPTTLFAMIEREFARPLSPMELQTISKWIDEDQHSDELVVAALREAIISNVRNIRYIDKILYNWKQNGITSKQQMKDYTDKFREKQPNRYYKKSPRQQEQAEEKTSRRPVPFFNWLEDGFDK